MNIVSLVSEEYDYSHAASASTGIATCAKRMATYIDYIIIIANSLKLSCVCVHTAGVE